MPIFIDVLKQSNKIDVKWTVPKKETDDYKTVMQV